MSKAKTNNNIPKENILPQPNSTSNSLLLIAGFLLAIVTFLIFKSSFDNKFVNWDDQVYVEEQPFVINKEYAKLWKTPISLNYHPVTMISLAIQAPKDIKKLQPKPFIQANVWLHIFNSILVLMLIWMINEKKWVVASIVAAIFAWHPMHVESVVWVSERKDVLYTFFFLLACITYWRYLEVGKKFWLLLTFFLFLLSILSKAVAVVLPIVLLLLDYWKGRKIFDTKSIVEKIPFFAASLFFGLMAVSVQSGGDFGGLLTLYGEKTKAVAAIGTFNIWERFQFATYGFFHYLFMFIYPSKIAAFHPYPVDNKLTGLTSILSPIAFIGVLALAFWSNLKTKIGVFGIGFYLVTIALVLQFMSVGLAITADRYTYVPYIGLAFLSVYTVDHWIAIKSKMWQYISLGIAGIYIIYLGINTASQVEVWQDSESLWTQSLKHYPTDDLALANRGNHRGKIGDIPGAIADFNKAISDGCNRADVYEGLGNSYGTMSEQQPDKKQELVGKAIEMYQKALTIEPTKGNIQYNLGVAQLQSNPIASVTAFTEALKLMPYKEADILPILGMSQLNATKYEDAILTLTKAIQAGNNSDAVFYYRGLANLGIGNKEAAKADFIKAQSINPNNQDVKMRLSTL